MSEPKHTATPWEVTRGRSYLDEEMHWMVAGVAHFGDGPTAEGNARLAARAVNSHQDLVEACRSALTLITVHNLHARLGFDAKHTEVSLRAALAKARPEGAPE